MKVFAMMSSIIILESNISHVWLAEKVRLWGYARNLTFINDPNITFQKLMRPDLIKCLKSGRMEQLPLLFSHRTL